MLVVRFVVECSSWVLMWLVCILERLCFLWLIIIIVLKLVYYRLIIGLSEINNIRMVGFFINVLGRELFFGNWMSFCFLCDFFDFL